MIVENDIINLWNSVDYLSKFVLLLTSYLLLGFLIKATYNLLRLVYLYCVCQHCDFLRIDLKKKYGQWAVVTGGTEGKGLAMACQLASRGLSVILLGKDQEKLEMAKETVKSVKGSSQVDTIKFNFTESRLETYKELCQKLKKDQRKIGIIINSIEEYPENAKRIIRFEPNDMSDQLHVNTMAATMMSNMLIGTMLHSGGLVVNVSSIAAVHSSPYLGIYSPTKAFISSLSQTLRLEHKRDAVEIVNLISGPCISRASRGMETSWLSKFVPSSELYAKSVINILSSNRFGCKSPAEFAGLASHELLLSFWNLCEKLFVATRLWELCLGFKSRYSASGERLPYWH